MRKLNRTLQTQSNFRLLVVRLGAMGDILHALPAVTALRLAHPTWQIGWVVDPRWQALLKAGTEGRGTRDTRNKEQRLVLFAAAQCLWLTGCTLRRRARGSAAR